MVFTGIVETFWEETGNKNIIKAKNIQPDYILFTNPDTYTLWNKNKHHWTTNYIWKNVIPKIIKCFELPFNEFDYEYVSNIVNNEYGTFDVSYHRYKLPLQIKFKNLSNNENLILNMKTIKCNPKDYNECSEYHSLFRGFHSMCIMENDKSLTDKILIFNCDSMAIPIIPILIPFYKKILILDNRVNKSFKEIIKTFMKNNCDVCEIFHADCWNHNKRFENLK